MLELVVPATPVLVKEAWLPTLPAMANKPVLPAPSESADRLAVAPMETVPLLVMLFFVIPAAMTKIPLELTVAPPVPSAVELDATTVPLLMVMPPEKLELPAESTSEPAPTLVSSDEPERVLVRVSEPASMPMEDVPLTATVPP